MSVDPIVHGYIVEEQHYPGKAVIIEEGSKGDWAYVVLQGNVRVTKKGPKGIITIDTLKEGAIFGEMAMLHKGEATRTASVTADGPVQLGVLDRDRLFDAYANVSPRIKSLLETMISRLTDTTNAITGLVGGQT
jgi:CRP/FNR family transcriptional regulator, cyclic AMP receptor protein